MIVIEDDRNAIDHHGLTCLADLMLVDIPWRQPNAWICRYDEPRIPLRPLVEIVLVPAFATRRVHDAFRQALLVPTFEAFATFRVVAYRYDADIEASRMGLEVAI